MYVSWNGDTETKVWRFYQVTDEYGSRQYLGETKRTGFETPFSLKSGNVHTVSAEAIGANGRVLTSTGIVKTQVEILPPPKGAEVSSSVSISDKMQPQVYLGQKSRWEEYMILKVDRFYLD